MELLRQFSEFYKPWKRLFYLDFGCAIVSGLLELAFPLAVAYFIDSLLPAHEWGWIIAASVALLVIYLFNTVLMVIVTYWGHMLGINIETELRRRAFDHIQKLSFSFSIIAKPATSSAG